MKIKFILSMCLAILCVNFSCKNSESETKVTNGRAISESKYPAVIKIVTSAKATVCNEAQRTWQKMAVDLSCTGTFIHKGTQGDTLITAAHCIEGAVGNSATTAHVNGRKVKSTKIFGNKGYYNNGSYSLANDLAIVIFPPNTAPATMELGLEQPNSAAPVTMVGYGCNEMTNRLTIDKNSFCKAPAMRCQGSGSKREGSNFISYYKAEEGGDYENMLRVDGYTYSANNSGTESILGSGDSGGPAIVDGKIVGIASFTDVFNQVSASTGYANINSAKNRSFLKSVADIGIAISGIGGVPVSDTTTSNNFGIQVVENNSKVMIVSVAPNSHASMNGLRSGQIIERFGEKFITSISDLRSALGSFLASGQPTIDVNVTEAQ